MAATTVFTPPKAPLIGANKTRKYAVKNADFGDGYVCRTIDGINNITRMYDLSWPALDPADADTIETFIDGTGGAIAFNYQVPGDSVSRQWTAGPPTRSDFGVYSSITCTFTEVHDP